MSKMRNFKIHLIAVMSVISILTAAGCLYVHGAALENEDDRSAELLERLYDDSGADKLITAVPEDSRELLFDVGFDGFMPGGTDKISFGGLLGRIGGLVRENAARPIKALSCAAAIVVLSAAAELAGGAAVNVRKTVTTLCMVSVTAPPLIGLTQELAGAITASGDFMLLYIPVISGLMAASGQPASGASYCGVMIWFGSAVMQITVRVVVPLMKCILALSVVTSVCSEVNINGVTELFKKAARFLMTFCMSLFAAFLTMRQIVTAAADSLSNRAVKFAIGSFVPLVGGALSDAYQTVLSCLSVLKSGVGAAAVAAIFAIFIPHVIRCAVWQAVAAAGGALCDLFGLSEVSSLLGSMSSVVSVMLAMLLCTMVIYIISTAIVIIVGG